MSISPSRGVGPAPAPAAELRPVRRSLKDPRSRPVDIASAAAAGAVDQFMRQQPPAGVSRRRLVEFHARTRCPRADPRTPAPQTSSAASAQAASACTRLCSGRRAKTPLEEPRVSAGSGVVPRPGSEAIRASPPRTGGCRHRPAVGCRATRRGASAKPSMADVAGTPVISVAIESASRSYRSPGALTASFARMPAPRSATPDARPVPALTRRRPKSPSRGRAGATGKASGRRSAPANRECVSAAPIRRSPRPVALARASWFRRRQQLVVHRPKISAGPAPIPGRTA